MCKPANDGGNAAHTLDKQLRQTEKEDAQPHQGPEVDAAKRYSARKIMVSCGGVIVRVGQFLDTVSHRSTCRRDHWSC